jgi:hypothetical protein
MSGERFHLELQATPGTVPAIIRLRRALKGLLRGYGLQCVRIREIETTESVTAGTSEKSGENAA